jgi:mono/diheme cytochrome c family protein
LRFSICHLPLQDAFSSILRKGRAHTWFLLPILVAPLLAHDRVSTKVTWTRDIAPLVESRCVSCHRPDGRGPMSLVTYEDARPWAKAIKEEVLTRRMPKWHAARGYGDFANDPSLSPFEIATIVAWVDGGAPKELPAVAAGPQPIHPTPRAASDRHAGRTVTLPCNDQPLPAGRLLAVQPRLEPGGSAGIAVRLPDGRREIVAWIRGFDPEFAERYWLRTPIVLGKGSRLLVEATSACSIVATIG